MRISGVTYSSQAKLITGTVSGSDLPHHRDAVWLEGNGHTALALLRRKEPGDRAVATRLLAETVTAQSEVGAGQTVGRTADPDGGKLSDPGAGGTWTAPRCPPVPVWWRRAAPSTPASRSGTSSGSTSPPRRGSDGRAELQPVPVTERSRSDQGVTWAASARNSWRRTDTVAAMTITSAPPEAPARPGKRVAVTVLVWLLLLPGTAWAVIRLGGWERGPLVQMFAFTPYAAVWAWIPALIALVTRRWLGAAVAVVAAALLTVAVLPRALEGDRGPSAGVELHVLTSNVLAGSADPETLVRLVRDNDVAVLAMQEFTPAIQTRLTAAGLDTLLPYTSLAAEHGTTGSAVYSRFPITEGGSRRNGGGFLQAYGTIQPPGAGPLLVESAHPAAPYSVQVLGDWRADLRSQPRPDANGPARILLGDFNATLDHKLLRDLIARGYRNAADADGAGLVGTWGAYTNRGPSLPPVTIDHVLVDRRIGVRDVEVNGVPGSDHRSVLASLTVPAA